MKDNDTKEGEHKEGEHKEGEHKVSSYLRTQLLTKEHTVRSRTFPRYWTRNKTAFRTKSVARGVLFQKLALKP